MDEFDDTGATFMSDRRKTRPRMSLGGIATMLGVAVGVSTLFVMLWQGARWTTNIDSKLDQALRQGVVIAQMQSDLLVLKTNFENSQHEAERVIQWLQSLARRIDGRSDPPPAGIPRVGNAQ